MTQNRRLEDMPTVLADANVLFSQEQRNILMTLAIEGLFRLRWTEKIEDEWVRNRGQRLLKAGKDATAPQRTAEKMRKAIPDFELGDWQRFVDDTGATHPGDRHVAAAAMACAPSHLLTWNLRDFDAGHLKGHRVTVWSPDDFLCEVYDENPVITYEASRRAHGFARSVAGRIPTWPEYLERLAGSGLPQFAARLEGHDRDDTLDDLPEVLSEDETPSGDVSEGP
ncbi:hypothetical protein [Mesorhizobium salmacidum]|uniref:VapC50 C-terminal domain-containing protein n=1 Tax=Mesorhizobium salmacidum TaxID=3015171 RepID=A0ABU8L3G2_9HYPH